MRFSVMWLLVQLNVVANNYSPLKNSTSNDIQHNDF